MHISRNNRPDPLEEVGGEPLVLLHEPLVVLVHLQHLADSVRRHLSLSDKNLHKDKKAQLPCIGNSKVFEKVVKI